MRYEKWTVEALHLQMFELRRAYRHLEKGDLFEGARFVEDEYLNLAKAVIKKEATERLDRAAALLHSPLIDEPIEF